MNEDRFVELLRNAVEAVKSEEDPVELNQYRKLYKKNVPLALRMYVAAYLAKNATGEDRGGRRNRRDDNRTRGRNQDRREQRTEREPREPREPAAPRVQIDEALATTIFISIGRNRKVFPRDLIGLIVQNANIERERIGDIRVLDNYSFVQLYTDDCPTVISALNDFEYRGRKLTVSYSRKKTEEEVAEAASNPLPETAAEADAQVADISVTDTTEEEEMSAEDAAAFQAATAAADKAGNSFLI